MTLAMRPARMDDAELLWRWANDPDVRGNAFQQEPIPWETHVAWLEGKLASGTSRLWVFSAGDEPVGQVRVDLEGEDAVIDISVASGRRGRGYGRRMLMEAIGRMQAERGPRIRPRAVVLEHNAPSLRLFRACGFRELGATVGPRGERAVAFALEPAANGRGA